MIFNDLLAAELHALAKVVLTTEFNFEALSLRQTLDLNGDKSTNSSIKSYWC